LKKGCRLAPAAAGLNTPPKGRGILSSARRKVQFQQRPRTTNPLTLPVAQMWGLLCDLYLKSQLPFSPPFPIPRLATSRVLPPAHQIPEPSGGFRLLVVGFLFKLQSISSHKLPNTDPPSASSPAGSSGGPKGCPRRVWVCAPTTRWSAESDTAPHRRAREWRTRDGKDHREQRGQCFTYPPHVLHLLPTAVTATPETKGITFFKHC